MLLYVAIWVAFLWVCIHSVESVELRVLCMEGLVGQPWTFSYFATSVYTDISADADAGLCFGLCTELISAGSGWGRLAKHYTSSDCRQHDVSHHTRYSPCGMKSSSLWLVITIVCHHHNVCNFTLLQNTAGNITGFVNLREKWEADHSEILEWYQQKDLCYRLSIWWTLCIIASMYCYRSMSLVAGYAVLKTYSFLLYIYLSDFPILWFYSWLLLALLPCFWMYQYLNLLFIMTE